MASAARVFADFKPVENLTLNGRAKTLYVFQPVLADGGFERVQIGEAEALCRILTFSGLSPGMESMSSTPSGTSRRSFSSKG